MVGVGSEFGARKNINWIDPAQTRPDPFTSVQYLVLFCCLSCYAWTHSSGSRLILVPIEGFPICLLSLPHAKLGCYHLSPSK